MIRIKPLANGSTIPVSLAKSRQTSEMSQTHNAKHSDPVPLVVSLDGALLHNDPGLETLWRALHTRPGATLGALLSGGPGRAARLQDIAAPDAGHLPLRAPVTALVRAAQAQGRRVVLVSAAGQALVDRLAARLGLAGDHFGSDETRRLAGKARAEALTAAFGSGGFDYLGSAAADLPIWRAARTILAVAPGPRLLARLASLGKPVETLGAPWSPRSLLREMRPTQWLKNLLLLLPLLLEHDLSPERLGPVLLAFAAFCAMTSSVYLVNDMLDLDADRRHPEKRNRPIASGALPIGVAMAAAPALIALSLILGSAVGAKLVAVQLGYLALATGYSLWLKHLAWLDLFVLATLYTLRLLAGATAAALEVTLWPVAFSFAVFFALSVVKRLTELARLKRRGKLAGRAYGPEDSPRLVALALVATLAAVAIFLAFTMSAEAAAHYSRLWILRLAALPVGAWLLRMVRSARNGEEDYDPLEFVTHDAVGLAIAASGILLLVLAI